MTSLVDWNEEDEVLFLAGNEMRFCVIRCMISGYGVFASLRIYSVQKCKIDGSGQIGSDYWCCLSLNRCGYGMSSSLNIF